MTFEGSSIAKTTLKKKDQLVELTLSDFKIHYKAIVFKAIWYWGKAGIGKLFM